VGHPAHRLADARPRVLADGDARRRPEETSLDQTVAEHWPRFREREQEAGGLPKFIAREFAERARRFPSSDFPARTLSSRGVCTLALFSRPRCAPAREARLLTLPGRDRVSSATDKRLWPNIKGRLRTIEVFVRHRARSSIGIWDRSLGDRTRSLLLVGRCAPLWASQRWP
jgi:hypothetical protein